MNNRLFVFPGQGSQSVGMSDCIINTEIGKKMFHITNNKVGYDLLKIILKGPEELLRQTKHTQPAIFTISMIIDQMLKDNNIYPIAVAGHSLGEYSALVSANVISFEDAIKLISTRSTEMNKANNLNKGAMAAVINISEYILSDIINEIPGIITIANYNSESQLVVSGNEEAIDYLSLKIKEAQKRARCIKLNVSGAFHSSLMKFARNPIEKHIKKLTFKDADIPVFQNINGNSTKDSIKIKENLILQLESSVQWSSTINNMIKYSKSNKFIECGPGNVLAGINRKISREIETANTSTLKEIKNL